MTDTEKSQAAPSASIAAGPLYVPLRNRAGEVIAHAVLDAQDAEQAEHRWFQNSDGYVVRNVPRAEGGQATLSLARVIMGLVPGDGLEVDHINRFKLDNQRQNLRIVTHAQNMQNRVKRGGTSRHRGVSWLKDRQKWRARARIDGTDVFIGDFESEEAAADAARDFRREHMPFSID